MRRVVLLPLLCLGLLAGPAYAAPGGEGRPPKDLPASASARAVEALTHVREILAGQGGGHRDLTLELAQLRLGYDALSASQKRQADAVLARPTDGINDDYDDGYTVAEATPVCSTNVCVHYVTTTTDAPPPYDGADAGTVPDWVETTRNHMQAVWNQQVGGLGYRAPASDLGLGGSTKFDVYLKDVGAAGLYGYCAPEDWVSDIEDDYREYAYCVLDDDFAQTQFDAPPLFSLRATAAHEFFHAIQFNYDAAEDPWIMEATATWMEERYADDVNDNRQYLSQGQLVRNGVPLDQFGSLGNHYGNWIFFELLSRTYGIPAVKDLWTRMDSFNGTAPDQYSTQAVKSFLATKSMPFQRFYARFGAANVVPAKFYEEGAAYPKAPIAMTYSLPANTPRTVSYTLAHQTNRNVALVPASTLTGTWRVKVTVDGPDAIRGPAAYVIVHKKDGTITQAHVPLGSTGVGTYYAAFSRADVARVTVTLANGSSRFTNCWDAETDYSCAGTPLDNGQVYKLTATAVR